MSFRPTNLPASGMLLLATIALGLGGKLPIWAAIVGAVVLLHALWGVRLNGKPRLVIMMLLALPMAVAYQDQPDSVAAPIYLLMMLGLYFQSLGVYQLLCSRSGGSVDNALGCAVAGMAFSGTIPKAPYLLPLFVAFMMLLLWQLRRGVAGGEPARLRVGRVMAYVLALSIAVGMAVGMERGAAAAIPELNNWVARKLFAYARPPSTLGFSRRARLDSMSEVWDAGRNGEVALRVWADREPGYLRGAIFDRYDNGSWLYDGETRELRPLSHEAGRAIFDATNQPAGQRLATVYPSGAFADAYFLPMGVHRLSAFTDAVSVQPGPTFRPKGNGAMGGYSYFAPAVAAAPANERDRHVPEPLRQPLDDILWTIIEPTDSPTMRIAKIERYFHHGFSYKLGLQLQTDKDPVIEFMTDIRAGHCEFFAASAALLLRRADIPARYVTGMVVRERGRGGTWLSRRKDAHAWVEAYLPDRGWTIVEATPPDFRPSAPTPTGGQRWIEMWQAYWQRIAAVFAYGGMVGILAMSWNAFLAFLLWVPVWAWTVIAVVATGWVFRASLLAMFKRRPEEQLTERAAALRAVLAEAERLVEPHGLRREPSTSVSHFLREVEQGDVPEATRSRAVTLLERYQATRFTK